MHATNKLMQQACKQTHMSHMCGKCVLHVEHMCGTQLDASIFTRGSTPKPVFLPSFYLLNNLDCLFVLGPEPAFGWLGLSGSSGEYSSHEYTSHEYTSHPLLRAFGTQLGGDILCQNICGQFGKPGLTESHGNPL